MLRTTCRKSWRARGSALAAASLASLLMPQVGRGAEGGSGEYLPGFASFMSGFVPPKPGFYLSNSVYYYTADANAVAANGLLAIDVEVDIALEVPTLTWIAPWKVLGADYGIGVTQGIGYVNLDVGLAPGSLEGSAETFGLTDLILQPAILGWHHEKWHWAALVNVYAPTGQYDENNAVNLSKNFWAIEPMFNITYYDPKSRFEISGSFGYTINFENNDTHYDSGDVFHADLAVAYNLTPALKIGAVGYAWVQVTGDSGDGALFGDFKSEVYGAGPAIDYVTEIGSTAVDFQLRWYHEFESRHRLEGDGIYFTLAFGF